MALLRWAARKRRCRSAEPASTIAARTSVRVTQKPFWASQSDPGRCRRRARARGHLGNVCSNAWRTTRRCAATLRQSLNRASNIGAMASKAMAAGRRGLAGMAQDPVASRTGFCERCWCPRVRAAPSASRYAYRSAPRHAGHRAPCGRIRYCRCLRTTWPDHRNLASCGIGPTGPYKLVKARTRQRIGDRDANIVRFFLANQVAGQAKIVPVLARIAELNKPAGADPRAFSARVAVGPRPRWSPFHRVENFLRTGFHAKPDFLGTGLGQCIDPSCRIRSTRDCIVKGMWASSRLTSSAKAPSHCGVDPKISSANRCAPARYGLSEDASPSPRIWRSAVHSPAESRLGAPVAGIGTTARRRHVPGKRPCRACQACR